MHVQHLIVGAGFAGLCAAIKLQEDGETDFLVVVLGLPVIALVLTSGWRVARRRVIADTGGRLGSIWTLDGPRYADSEATGGPTES